MSNDNYYVVCEPKEGLPYVLHIDGRSLRDAQCSVAWQQRAGYGNLTYRICRPDPNLVLTMFDTESEWQSSIRHPYDDHPQRTFTGPAIHKFFETAGWSRKSPILVDEEEEAET